MLKSLFTFVLLSLSFVALASGDDIVDNEAELQKYLAQQTFDIDTGAKAIILYEKGSSIIDNGKFTYQLVRTIKILNKDAIEDLAKIDISFDRNGYVSKIRGVTYNLENGKIVKQSVDRSDILKDNVTKNTLVNKFNLPSVKVGSIIHYSYTREQPGFIFVPSWDFQDEYPTLYSEYQIRIPKYVVYDAIERINVPVTRVNRENELSNCVACSFDNSFGETDAHTWIRRNVPAFKSEPMMGSNANYLERVKIHVKGLNDHGVILGMMDNWKNFSNKFFYKNNDGCGQPFNGNAFLKEEVEALTKGKTTDMEKSKAIYSYVRDSFEVKDADGEKSTANIKDVFRNKSGSVWGINLLLTAMLRKAGINSAPVLLSTRKNEKLNEIYPDPDAINYLVSMAVVDQKKYFLDASEHEIPFGVLLPKCYNGYCRIITEEGGSAYLSPDSFQNKATIMATLKPAEKDKTKLLLKVDQQFGQLSALQYRKNWREDSVAIRKEMLKYLDATYHVTPDRFLVKNLTQPDEKLAIEYEATIDLNDAVTVYFDPYLVKFFDNNPFASMTRQYPVEMDYQQDINYIFRFQLPEGYAVDDYPKSSLVKLGEHSALSIRNTMSYDEAGRSFGLNSRYVTLATNFDADGYKNLHDFYENLIEEQHKKIVLKKIK